MPSESQQPLAESDLLVAHGAWVRALAARLVADPGQADDILQDTWLAAREAPAGIRSPRRWLACVVRNLARQSRRSEHRRREREQGAAQAAAQAPADAALERAELGSLLVRHVMALDEPFRSAILLRYYENLPPR